MRAEKDWLVKNLSGDIAETTDAMKSEEIEWHFAIKVEPRF